MATVATHLRKKKVPQETFRSWQVQYSTINKQVAYYKDFHKDEQLSIGLVSFWE